MNERPDVKSVVHCHPPHATAFAVAREPIPQCVLPEVEVFLGDVPITKYETPGGQVFADTVLPFVKKSNVIILANHGTVSFGESVERAYWWTEILDAYCRILMLARDLGRVNYFTEAKERELLDLKTKWGYKDARLAPGMENCDICANDVFRESWTENGISAGIRSSAGNASRRLGPTSRASAGRHRSRDARSHDHGSCDGSAERKINSPHGNIAFMKVSIIGGAGLVGSCTAFALQTGRVVREIALLDVNAELVEGQALDLLHGTSLMADQVITSGSYEHVPTSDLICITAGLRRKPDESRLDLINRNVDLFLGILDNIQRVGLKSKPRCWSSRIRSTC